MTATSVNLFACVRTARELAEKQVLSAFPSVAFVDFQPTCQFIGISVKTGNNLVWTNRFPLPILRRGVKKVIPVPALVDFLEKELVSAGYPAANQDQAKTTQLQPVCLPPQPPLVPVGSVAARLASQPILPGAKRGPGRPRNSEKGVRHG